MVRRLKSGLTRIGARSSPATIHRLNAAVNYLEVGRWMHAHGFDTGERVDGRDEIFAAMARGISDEQVLYLEFGVYRGDSMRRWSELLRNPASHLHGFDSFEGLPERWSLREDRGHFSTAGAIPELDDPRVRFFRGWFEQTLADYRAPPHECLVVNIDADVFSSAATALAAVEPWLRPGSFLYFDEFNDRFGELRAFDEFLARTDMRFGVVAASRELSHVAFKRAA